MLHIYTAIAILALLLPSQYAFSMGQQQPGKVFIPMLIRPLISTAANATPQTPPRLGVREPDQSPLTITFAIDSHEHEKHEKLHRPHATHSMTNLASLVLANREPSKAAAEDDFSPSASQSGRSRALTLTVDKHNLMDATPAELESIIEQLIEQACTVAFGPETKITNESLKQELKHTLLQAFDTYLHSPCSSPSDPAEQPLSSSSSSSDASQHELHSATHRTIDDLRYQIFRHISERRMGARTAAAAGEDPLLERPIRKTLKALILKEIEEHDRKMRTQLAELVQRSNDEKEQLKQDASAEKTALESQKTQALEELRQANRKTLYGLLSNVITLSLGIAGSLVTYYTTHSCSQASD